MSGEPILVVDDNPTNLKLLRLLLLAEGYQVKTAGSAPETLDVLESFVPRLIFMDLQLPGMSGLDLVRILKKRDQMRSVIIVALTAFAMLGDEEKAFDAGCDGYITKPIDTRSLPDQVRKYLGD